MRRMPERADLLFLTRGCKGLLLHTQCNQVFEVLGFGIAASALPFPYCAAGDTQQPGQSSLRQPDARSQRQHELTEGIISLTIRGSFHGQSPFRMSQ